MTHTEPHFAWTCSYMGCIWYRVRDETGCYEVEVRREASDYERSIYNGGEDQWQREVVGAIDTIRRNYNSTERVPESTVRAFNEWRLAEHDKLIARMDAQPERYGLEPDDPLRKPPAIVRGAYWDLEKQRMVTVPSPMDRFERELERGCGYAPNGARYLLTEDEISFTVERTYRGNREKIVGFNGARFGSWVEARNWAKADGEREIQPNVPLCDRPRAAI